MSVSEGGSSCLTAKEDRYGGVEISVEAGVMTSDFARELQTRIAAWEQAGKRGLWLTIPISAAECVGPATSAGFDFHHAKPG